MSLNLTKTLLSITAGMLLVTATVTSSDARMHGKRHTATQREYVYYHLDANNEGRRDNSCFHLAGLPEMYSCSGN